MRGSRVHPLEGDSPHVAYHAALPLEVGEVLSFVVGVGPNGTNFNDTTGALVHLVAR